VILAGMAVVLPMALWGVPSAWIFQIIFVLPFPSTRFAKRPPLSGWLAESNNVGDASFRFIRRVFITCWPAHARSLVTGTGKSGDLRNIVGHRRTGHLPVGAGIYRQ